MYSFESWLGRDGLLPHGYCFTWDPVLLRTMVASDALISLAYLSIPMTLLYFIRRRPDVSMKAATVLFSLFIFSCGTTHALDIWTIWVPDYRLQAFAKTITAVSSIATAVMLWLLMPRALSIPSVAQLQTVIAANEREILERRRMAGALEDARNNLTATLSGLDAGIITTDAEGLVLEMNAVAERVTGWPLVEAKGQSLWAVWHREGLDIAWHARSPIEIVIERGLNPSDITRLVGIGRDGSRTPMEVSCAVTRTPDSAIRGLVIVFRDMTRLDRGDSESRQLAALVASSSEAIIGKDLDGKIFSWNRAAELLFGYRADEMIGESVHRLMSPERLAEEQQHLARLAAGESVAPFETEQIHKNGNRLVVAASLSPIHDADGNIIGLSRLVRDISSQLKEKETAATAAKLLSENRQIVEATRLKSSFLANMSHELRTPLNSIIGFSDVLASDMVPAGSEKAKEFLSYIRTSGKHLLQLINDILDLSKVEAGKFVFNPEPIDLSKLIVDAVSLLRNDAERKSLQLSIDHDEGLDDIVLDAGRLKQVLYNYLSNAIKFTEREGTVIVRSRAIDGQVWRLEVEDTGIGIAQKSLSRLFVEFQQLDSGYTKSQQGTGLGLSLTKRLVEAQGGTVGVHSVLGRGSIFYAELPRKRPSHAEDSGYAALTANAPIGRALVFMDDLSQQAQVRRLLQTSGFEVESVQSVSEAHDHVTAHRYQALSLDLSSGDGAALALLADARARTSNAETPVVVLTVKTDAGKSGAFVVADLLPKPLDFGTLQGALKRVGPPESSALRVLVIDDDRRALALAEEMLSSLGVRVLCLPESDRALIAVENFEPHAILLDLMMPHVDGFEILDRLRRSQKWKSLPVFLWTNMTLSEVECARLARSARTVVSKSDANIESLWSLLRTVPLYLPNQKVAP